jgi:hypothetical protein
MDRRGFLGLLAGIVPAFRAHADLAEAIEGRAFAGAMYIPRERGQYGFAQLWNPPGSGRTCILLGVSYDTPDHAAPFGCELLASTVALPTLVGNPKNRIVGRPASVMQLRTGKASEYPKGDIYGFPHLSQRMKHESFAFTAILLPGYGMTFAPEVKNVQVCLTWSHVERPLAN